MKGSWKEILLNVLFWIASIWIITSGFSIERQEIQVINGIEKINVFRSGIMVVKLSLCVGISFLLFYLNLWNITRLGSTVRRRQIFLQSLLLLIMAIGMFYLIETLGLTGDKVPLPYSLSLGITAFYFTISTAYGLAKVWLVSEQQQQQLRVDKKQAELNLLRNQLQPHFLFNSLNNLLAMVDQEKSPQLADAFERLSGLLRYVIDETQNQNVSVGREIGFIKNYVALQLLRFEKDEVDFQLRVEGEYASQAVEPGLFIPFVENAFKYGTEPEGRSSIEVLFDIQRSDEIRFAISNSITSGAPADKKNGTGIRTTRERLNLAYPHKHSIDISEGPNFRVTLKIETQ